VPIARGVGLPKPLTQVWIEGRRVDFYWPHLKLVVETDGGRFHRTPMQQTDDRRREHALYLADYTPLRFTHGQIRYAPEEVEAMLRKALERIGAAAA
jgi:very-short-patch-repair endonuclease